MALLARKVSGAFEKMGPWDHGGPVEYETDPLRKTIRSVELAITTRRLFVSSSSSVYSFEHLKAINRVLEHGESILEAFPVQTKSNCYSDSL